ncbi:MAG: S8 family serine peptidase [Thermomicrobiales bacterium]
MRRHTRWSRVFAVLFVVFALVMSALPAAADDDDNRKERGFSKEETETIATARAQGENEITVLIASKPGANGAVVSQINRLGGRVQRNETKINYIRAIIPLDKAEATSKIPDIQGIDLDGITPLDDPKPNGAQAPTPQTPPGPTTPNINPYMPIGDTGAAQFTAANRRYDGRGVTVGVVDSGIDLDHPSLKTTSTGQRKIIDWVTQTDPTFTDGVNNDDDPTWILMNTTPVSAGGNTISYMGKTLTLPNEPNIVAKLNTYRIGVFDERDPRLGGELGNDVNRDGNPAGSSGLFFVLWNGAKKVWVDSNQDLKFTEPAMQNYKEKFDIGTFGTDNPATAVREAMPFVVQIEASVPAVNIGIVSGEHGSHVAGIIAANKMFGGTMNGAAPGAKLVSVRACLFVDGCTNHALIEGMIYLAEAGVDVINMSIGGLPLLNDGNNARAILYNNIIDAYNIQMFISAGNEGAGMNTVGDPSVATKVVSVGSYVTAATWRADYGSDAAYDDNLHGFSSRGPREDGGFKPNIVAPGAAISTIPTWMPGGPVGGTYLLPPGYAMLNGTSMASPQATGAAALLLGAAKGGGDEDADPFTVTAAQLRQAIYSSARLLDTSRIQVFEQGNGLINVGAAWNLLRQNIKTVNFTSSVEVNGILEDFLATPGVGVGIYDRPVEESGSYVRTYTFTRSNGGSGNKTYQVSWVGNDGTFSSAASIQLPLNTPRTLDVTINPTTVGAHSAILNLNDPSTVGIDYQTMNVVVVPEEFVSGSNYTQTHTDTIGRNEVKRYFFAVPSGTPAFKVDLMGGGSTPDAGQIRFLRFHPYGVSLEDNSSLSCYNPDSGGGCPGGPSSRTVSNPTPGVWEIIVEARRTSDTANAPFTLTASILGATVSPNPDTITSATIGMPVARSYTLNNIYGDFTGRAVGTTLGSAKIQIPTIANGASNSAWSMSLLVRPRFARQSVAPLIRGPIWTSTSTTARPDRASWPGKAPTATPRSR